MDYEVVIPAAAKDYVKLPFLIESLGYLNPKPQCVRIICPLSQQPPRLPYPMKDKDNGVFNRFSVNVHDELNILPGLSPHAAVNFRRPPWIYQQFIKLFQDITDTRHYLVIDADLVINHHLDLLTGDKPKFFLGIDQNHEPYFRYSQDLFGFGREYNHSFISEIMMFDKYIINALLHFYHVEATETAGFNRDESIRHLYDTTCARACDEWMPADYELYGNFVEKFYPNQYTKTKLHTNIRGKLQEDWSYDEMQAYVDEMKDKDYDVFTAHTWL
jgi:hypothetical protein